jgi:hypothetical protein
MVVVATVFIEDTMTSFHPCARALLAVALAGAACLGNAAAIADPADPDAAVPATTYQAQPVFRPAPSIHASPAHAWQALNREVAAYDSMALTMAGDDAPAPAVKAPHGQHAAHAGSAAPAQDPHAHHKDAR